MRPMTRRLASLVLCVCACVLVRSAVLDACTAFCATGGGLVLVGNNEDWSNPLTKLWFVPATPGSFGRMYVGFDDMYPQGGMNERGLWFDGFAVPLVKAAPSGLPGFPGNIVDRAMAECSTVEDVIRLFTQYDRSFLSRGILMFADASGDAVAIEVDAMVRKTRNHFVQTNFHQSRSITDNDRRFRTATDMLERAGGDISVDLFRTILGATFQKGPAPTLYSNIYELRSRTMHLYYFHDFERAVTFRLAEELPKGARVLDIPALFPPNPAAERYAARRKPAPSVPLAPFAAGVGVVVLAALGLSVFGVIRGGRRVRLALGAAAALVALSVLATAAMLHLPRRASAGWTEFSLGPASGKSSWIGTNGLRSDGMTLKTAIATAYDFPTVRVIGPPWLEQTRYSINASVPPDAQESFRTLLQQELTTRLRLRTHTEVRAFDIFVLTAADASRLQRAAGDRPNLWVHSSGMDAQEASIEHIARTLQGVLSAPVIDETGLSGTFELDIEWTEDRVASITASLERHGLRLTPSKRDLLALVVDDVRRDAALVVLDRVGRLTDNVPSGVRQAVANMMTIR